MFGKDFKYVLVLTLLAWMTYTLPSVRAAFEDTAWAAEEAPAIAAASQSSLILVPSSREAVRSVPIRPSVPANTCAVYNVNLGVGSRGAEVTKLSELLARDGIISNKTDYYSEDIAAAVVKYQAKHNLVMTGYFGPATRAFAHTAACAVSPISVSLVNTSIHSDTNGYATFEISFAVKAAGADVYISANSPDLIAATTTPGGTNVGVQYVEMAKGSSRIVSDDVLASLMKGDSAGSYYMVSNGQTRTFKLQVVAQNSSTSASATAAIGVKSINWGTSPSAISQHYLAPSAIFTTDPLTWKTSP